tara:strand:+ start:197 stop:379 length:183 start_codon:yes stop_codon:yes gene_type:complete
MAAQHNFASPAYWHIQALVGDLRADNAAEALSELEHVSSWPGRRLGCPARRLRARATAPA